MKSPLAAAATLGRTGTTHEAKPATSGASGPRRSSRRLKTYDKTMKLVTVSLLFQTTTARPVPSIAAAGSACPPMGVVVRCHASPIGAGCPAQSPACLGSRAVALTARIQFLDHLAPMLAARELDRP